MAIRLGCRWQSNAPTGGWSTGCWKPATRVVPVPPNAIKAWRDAEVLSGAKHDPGDAALIAEYLRLRQHRLRVLAPLSGETRALRAVVRTRDDLIDQRVAAANQLGGCLEAFWPGAKAIFADLASRSPWTSSPPTRPGVGRQPARRPAWPGRHH